MKTLLAFFLLLVNTIVFSQIPKCTNFSISITAVDLDEKYSVKDNFDVFNLCQGSTMSLKANFASTIKPQPNIVYLWQRPDGTTVGGDKILLSQLSDKSEGDYILTAKISGSCADTTITLKKEVIIGLPKFYTQDYTICQGSDLQLNLAEYNGIPLSEYSAKSRKTYSWKGPNGFISTEINPKIPKIMESGIYTATVSFSGFCSGNLEINTNINVTNTSEVGSSHYYSDLGKSVTLQTKPSITGAIGKYTWIKPNGGKLEGQSITISNLSKEDQGAYKVFAKFEGGCNNSDSTFSYLTINSQDLFNLSRVLPFCEGNDITLPFMSSSTPFGNQYQVSYKWTGPNGYLNYSREPKITNFTSSKSGFYTLEVTVMLGNTIIAKGSEQTWVSPSNQIEVGISDDASIKCNGETVNLSSFAVNDYSNNTYLWKGPNNFTSTLRYCNIKNFTSVNEGVYTLFVYTKGCKDPAYLTKDIKLKNVKPKLSIIVDNGPNYCKGTDVYLFTEPNFYLSPMNIEWTGPNGFKASGASISIQNLNEKKVGTYYAKVIINSCGEFVSDSVTLKIIQMPKVSASDSVFLCKGGTGYLGAYTTPNYSPSVAATSTLRHGTISYEWTGPNNFKSNQQYISIKNFRKEQEGAYKVTVTFTGACNGSETKTTILKEKTPSIKWTANKLCNGKVLFNFSSFIPSNNFWRETKILDPNKIEVENPIDKNKFGIYTLETKIMGNCNFSDTQQIDIKDAKAFSLSLPEKFEKCINSDFYVQLSRLDDWGTGAIGAGIQYSDLGYSNSRIYYKWEVPNPNTDFPSIGHVRVPHVQKENEGIYKVTGRLDGECSGLYTAETRLIVDTEKPTANFDFIKNTNQISLENKSTGRVSDYSWDFGNGQNSNLEVPPTITYSSEGTFKIELKASNSCGISKLDKSFTYTKEQEIKDPIKDIILGVDSNISGSNYQVFPNPAFDIIEIENSFRQNAKVSIYDISSRLLDEFNIKIEEPVKRYNLNNYPSGVYIIRLVSEKGITQTKKVVVSK